MAQGVRAHAPAAAGDLEQLARGVVQQLADLGLARVGAAVELLLQLPQRQQQRAGHAHADRCAYGRRTHAAAPARQARLGVRRRRCLGLARLLQALGQGQLVQLHPVPAGQLGQPAVVHGLAQVLAQALVALPLRLVEELVARGLVRKAGVALGVGQQVQIQADMQVGLDDQQRALALAARRVAVAVAYARQQHAAARAVVGQLVGREHGQVVAGQAEQARGLLAAVELDLGVQVDARLAHQVLDVGKAVLGVGAGVRQDDEVALALDQRVHAGVVEMPAVRQIPPGPRRPEEPGARLAPEHQRLGPAPPQPGLQRCQRLGQGRLYPVAQAYAEQKHHQRPAARGVGARARRRRRARDGHPAAQRAGGAAGAGRGGAVVPAQHLLRADLQRARRGDHQPPLAVGVEQARGVVTRLVQAGAYQVQRAAVGLGVVAGQIHVVARGHLGHAAQAGIGRREGRADAAPPVAHRQPGAHQARLVEARQRGGIRRLRQPRRGQPPPQGRQRQHGPAHPGRKAAQQRQRGLGKHPPLHGQQPGQQQHQGPQVAGNVQQQRAQRHGVARLGLGRQLLQDRRQPAQHEQQGAARAHAAPDPARRLAAGEHQQQPPAGPVQRAGAGQQQTGQQGTAQPPGQLVAQPRHGQQARLAGQRQAGHGAGMAQRGRPQRQHQQGQHQLGLAPGLQQWQPARAQRERQGHQDQPRQQKSVAGVEAAPGGIRAARLGRRPVAHQQAGQQGRGPQQSQGKPGRGPALPGRGLQPAQAVLQQMRQGQRQRHRHQREEGLDVHRQKGAQIGDDENAHVARAGGREVAAVAAQPAEHVGVARGQHLLRLRQAQRADQSPQHGAHVAAAGDGGQVVHAPEQPLRREATQQAQAKGGAAHAAARQRQPHRGQLARLGVAQAGMAAPAQNRRAFIALQLLLRRAGGRLGGHGAYGRRAPGPRQQPAECAGVVSNRFFGVKKGRGA